MALSEEQHDEMYKKIIEMHIGHNEEQHDEMYKKIIEMHREVCTIKTRGCQKGMEDIKTVAINLEKNTREHIWVKGAAAVLSVITMIAGFVAGFFWKKSGG